MPQMIKSFNGGRLLARGSLCAFLSVLLMHPLLVALAQSGRVVAPPPAPTPQATLPSRPEAKRRAPGDDEYKLVFATSYGGKLSYVIDSAHRKQLDLATRSEMNGFLEQLNKVGEQGYKLESAIYRGLFLVGLAKLEESHYEYAAFDTTSNYFFSVGLFEKNYAALSRRGFRLVHHSSLYSYCEDLDPDHSYLGQHCEYTHRFLLEREKGVEKPRTYVLVSSNPWKTKPRIELPNLIHQKLVEGFYPTNAVSGYEVLLEQLTDVDEHLTDKPTVQVVHHSSFNDLKKAVNDFANQGYRLALSNDAIAVMFRNGETATPVKYLWLKADKTLDRQLEMLQQSGALYRMILWDYEGSPSILVFEQNPVDEKRREYKVMRFEFQLTQNSAERKVYISLTPSSQETMRVLNKLVKEGFAVRDLFVSNEVSVLLERSL